MELDLFEICRRKKLNNLFFLSLLSVVVFFAGVCTPVYLWAASDILVKETVFPLIWDLLMTVVNYLFYWIAYALVLYSVFRFGLSNSKAMLGGYVGIIVVRYPINLVANFFMNGFPTWNDFRYDELPYLFINIALDLVQMAVFVAIIQGIYSAQPRKRFDQKNTVLLTNMPIVKLFQFFNPAQVAALCGGIVPASMQLLARIFYDISFGTPVGITDFLWMTVSYLSDIFYVLIGYCIIVLFLNQLFFAEEKAKLEDKGLFSEQ